ncbi:MAG: DUF4345 domain-containing protein [Actinomycetota bacterium]
MVLTIAGIVAVAAGGHTVLTGGDSVPEPRRRSAGIDSELRFYAAWYVVAGVLLLRAVHRVEAETVIVRAVGAAFLLAGSARLLSLVTVGRPHAFALVLMVMEFVIPVVIVPWQAAVARSSAAREHR